MKAASMLDHGDFEFATRKAGGRHRAGAQRGHDAAPALQDLSRAVRTHEGPARWGPVSGTQDPGDGTARYGTTRINWRAAAIAATVNLGAAAMLLSLGLAAPVREKARHITTIAIPSAPGNPAPPPPAPPPANAAPKPSAPRIEATAPPRVQQRIALSPASLAAPAPAALPAEVPAIPVAAMPAPAPPPASTAASTPESTHAAPAPAPITPPDFSAAQLGNAGPKYPYLARRNHQQGTVMVKVLVTPQGRAGQVLLSRSSGHDMLDKAAIKTVRGWRFAPARQAGRPVEAWVLVPVSFSLS